MRAHPHRHPRPIVELAFRDQAGVEDVALATAANVMRAQLERETGDQLDLAIALRIMAPAVASYHAALVAQRGAS